MLTQFAKVLTQNVLLLRQADSAKIWVTPEEWKGLEEHYRGQLDTLRLEMGLDTASLRDSSAGKVDRDKVAAMKVDQYFDQLVAGKSRLRPLPSALATLLRDRSEYRIYEAGVNRAVELAEAERAKTDSTQVKGAPMQPAPGPAPIPGMGPAAPSRQGAAPPKIPSTGGDTATVKR
jgi:hypothetical protein